MPTATKTFDTVRSEIAGIPISEIVAKFGTPTYVYDMAVIEERVRDLAAFDVIRYAQKACSNIGILNRLNGLGVVVDAVSVGEVRRAWRLALKHTTSFSLQMCLTVRHWHWSRSSGSMSIVGHRT